MDVQPALVQVRSRPQPAVSPRPVYPDVRRLLVVRDDRLGDVVLSLPAVARLRQAYPDAEIGMLVQPALAPLVTLFGPVDRVVEAKDDLAGAIRAFAPDVAVCISRRARAAWALRRAGVRRVTGTGRRWFSFLFDRRIRTSRRRALRHEVEHAFDLAAVAGASADGVDFAIDLPSAVRADVQGWLERHGVTRPLVLHPGSAGSCPGWPARNWRSLAEQLRDTGIPVLVTEGPADREALRPFDASSFPRFARPLPDLAALLNSARLVVSNSTGPIHLAAALGTPTLAIHAPWTSCGVERWGPYRDNGWALVVESTSARHWSRRRRKRSAEDLMGRLSVQEVLRSVRGLWTI